MALAKLDQNEKIRIVANSSLEYTDKEGQIKQKEPKTAALNVIKEAAQVAKMDLGPVQASFKQGENWENYWVNVDEKNNNVSLKPCNSNDKNKIVYVNAFNKEGGKYDLSINDKNEAGKAFVEGLQVKAYVNEQEATTRNYVQSSITLTNANLKKDLLEKGEGGIAVLSDSKFEVTTTKELSERKLAKEQEKAQEASKGVEAPSAEKKPQAAEMDR